MNFTIKLNTMPRSDVAAAAASVAPCPLFPSLACSNWNVKRLTRRFVSWLHLELCDLLDALREWSRKWRVALETKLTNGHLSCRLLSLLLLLLLLLWLMGECIKYATVVGINIRALLVRMH